jgi:hypothetical protein
MNQNPMRPNPGGTPPFTDQYAGGIPILLSSSLDLASGATGIPPLQSLQSPFREAMMIDSVKFLVRGLLPSASPTTGYNFAGMVRTRFKMGRIELSHDFIPVGMYGPAIQDPTATGTPPEATQATFAEDGGGVTYTLSHFRWILPRPLYVPAGSVLVPSIQRILDDGFPGTTLTIDVSYSGRRLAQDPLPKEIDVPYVALFAPPETVPGVATSASSADINLVNPFLVPLHVQRLMGRIMNRTTSPNLFDQLGGAVQVLMKDSYGQNMVRDFLPWNMVYDVNRRAWTINQVLKPKERYYASITGMTATATQFSSAFISMIGYRKETL